MGYKAVFNGWNEIRLEDLVVAYRKAKADCYFENTFPSAIKFAEYERDLLGNLKGLLELIKGEQGFSGRSELLGDFRLLPKKLSAKPKEGAPQNGHVHFSNPDRAVEYLLEQNEIIPEFRVVGDFPVDSHILSALWINTIGHKFDAGLEQSCYGARLKRIRNDELFVDKSKKDFHISAVGSFAPYFQPYQKWRNDGLNAIRSELEKERHVIAVSLDLKSYYHYIDPIALTSPELHKELNLDLSGEELDFTSELASFLCAWARGASTFAKGVTQGKAEVSGGLVIGLTASRIISNVLLHRWDKLVRETIAPIHYGRYVDDMFLVLRDTGTIKNSQELMLFLQQRMGNEVIVHVNNADDTIWQIRQGQAIQGDSEIKLQADKQKLFLLQGRAGLDLLDSIEKEIYELSSEHRLMPLPDQLEDSTAARVLSAAGSVGENADTLRRADGLTIRRLSWSLQLRHVETLARDLPPHEWQEQREEFYQFGHNHILRPDNLFAHFTYLPRLLGFAIGMNEWPQAEQIALRAYQSLDHLAKAAPGGAPIAINGAKAKAGNDLWRVVKGTLTWLFIDAATRYYDPNRLLLGKGSRKEKRLSRLFLNGIFDSLITVRGLMDFRFGSEEFYRKAPLVALADLAKEPYKRILRTASAEKLVGTRDSKKESRILKYFRSADLINVGVLEEFLNSTRHSRLEHVAKDHRRKESYLPYIFPTRPLTPAEISELAPECVGFRKINGKLCEKLPSVVWAQYTQAIRGVWIKPALVAGEREDDESIGTSTVRRFTRIGVGKKGRITVALTNIKTDDRDWSAMACNKSNLSRERYQRISELVNQAIHLKPRPDYLIFPELSIPLRWVNSLASRLNAVGISLIAGTEYRHFQGGELLSEACLVLTDNRLGYPAAVKIWQPKLEPAVGEDKELTSKYGRSWAYQRLRYKRRKPVYMHNGICFGVMVCSELQNAKARIKFQGAVDALMVLSWNQDLDTFAALIESAALDVHAYTILVNNRKYGDSRVRAPSKDSFLRDIARVRGGDNDFVVAATLDVDALRAFQSRAKRWPSESDKFKPLPEGFRLAKVRRRLPPQ
ncbi:hypothetical protein D9M69_364900 [compost metagenome]